MSESNEHPVDERLVLKSDAPPPPPGPHPLYGPDPNAFDSPGARGKKPKISAD